MTQSSKPLKIAHVAPVVESVPPKKYGGTERVVYALTEELVKRGHRVTLFASGDSATSARLISVYPRALREAKFKDLYGLNDITLLNIGLAYKMQEEFDLIHDHTVPISLPTANISKTPVVATIHGPITPTNKRLFETLSSPSLVGISKSQAAAALDGKVTQTIYNGLEMQHYPFSLEDEGYLLFVGRISQEKGVHLAIEVAQYLSIPLVIAAKLDSIDLAYFNEYVGPRLSDEYVKWIGEVDEQQRNELMSKALCFLHPATWREPFGLALIEAMACGCPVIASNRGSIPEIVVDGKTGFVVSDVDDMIEAVLKIKEIDRRECRRHALQNFNAELMTDRYEELYYQVLRNSQPV